MFPSYDRDVLGSILAMHEIVLPLLHQALICTAEQRGCLKEPR